MRAVVVRQFGEPGQLRLEPWPDPVAGAGEVVVRVAAIGVNFADLLVVGGSYQSLPPPPFVPGEELAGTVVAVGPGVTALAPGDRVLGLPPFGAYAELAAVKEIHAYRLPAAMSFTDAAGFGAAYQTAWFALTDRARLEPGETVLVTGAGGSVGMACLALARAMGARPLAVTSSPAKEAALLAAGAEAVIVLGAGDNVGDSLRAATGGAVIDVVIDLVGGALFSASLRCLAWRGRAVVVGFAGGDIAQVKTNYLLLKTIAVSGLQANDYRDRRPDWARRVQDELFARWAAGELAAHVAATHDFDDVAGALEAVRDRRVTGKMVVTVPELALLLPLGGEGLG